MTLLERLLRDDDRDGHLERRAARPSWSSVCVGVDRVRGGAPSCACSRSSRCRSSTAAPGMFAAVPATPPVAPAVLLQLLVLGRALIGALGRRRTSASSRSSRRSSAGRRRSPSRARRRPCWSSAVCAIADSRLSQARSAAIASAVATPMPRDDAFDSEWPCLVDDRDVLRRQAGDGVRDQRDDAAHGGVGRAMPPQVSSGDGRVRLLLVGAEHAALGDRQVDGRAADARDVLDLRREHRPERTRCTFICDCAVGLRQATSCRAATSRRCRSIATPALPTATRASLTLLDGTSTVVPPSASFDGMPAPASAACISPACAASRFVKAGA